MPVDVLDDDDRVVDQHAQRQDQAEEHDEVEGEAQGLERQEGQQHRQRDREADEEAAARAHEGEHHAHDEDQRGEDAVLELADHVADVAGLVGEDPVAGAGRPPLRVEGDQALDLVGHVEDVGAGALGDRHRHRRQPVHPRVGLAILVAVDDARQVAHEDGPVAHPLDGDLFDLLGAGELAGHAQQQAAATRCHLAPGDVDVLVADGVDDVVELEAVVADAVGEDLDPHLPGPAARDLGVQHPRHPGDLVLELLGDALELGLVGPGEGDEQHRDVREGDLADRGLVYVAGQLGFGAVDAIAHPLKRVLDDHVRLELERDDAQPLGRGGAHLLDVAQARQLVLDGDGDQPLDVGRRDPAVGRGDHHHRDGDVG